MVQNKNQRMFSIVAAMLRLSSVDRNLNHHKNFNVDQSWDVSTDEGFKMSNNQTI